MCSHNAYVNAPGFGGMRPLHEAVENGHCELARLLLAFGADPTLTTYSGQTCLALASDKQTERLLQGYIADLKGKFGEEWFFLGPSRFLGKFFVILNMILNFYLHYSILMTFFKWRRRW